MRPFGCKVYWLNRHVPRGNKMESRALAGHLLGYDSTNIWRIWNPHKRRLVRTRDVVFEWDTYYEGPENYVQPSKVSLTLGNEIEWIRETTT
jgi:hypothetical protein